MAALVLFLLLLAAELSLRGYHALTFRQRLPIELRPETRSLTWEEIEHKVRIVCLGDSNTFGQDLAYAQTYPAVLQDLLRERYPELDAVVINAGICGDTSVQGLARLERDVLCYQPHVVVSAFGLNDGHLGHWPLDPIREHEMYGERSFVGRVESWLEHTHLYLTLRARGRRLLQRLGWQPALPAVSVAQDPQPRVSRDGFADAQEQLVTRIQEHGTAALVMTITPVTDAFSTDLGPAQRQRQLAIYDDYNRIIRAVAMQHGAFLVDMQAIWGNEAHSELPSLLAADGVHWTAAGERLVALSTLQALEASGLIQSVIATGTPSRHSLGGGEAKQSPYRRR
jgi:lysophospholipase L1-like esterase